MFEPLERDLSGRLQGPGHYELCVAPHQVLGLSRKVARIRSWVSDWVCQTAPVLELGSPEVAPGHFLTARVPGTELDVTLARWKGRDGQLRLVFGAPPDSAAVLRPSFDRAMREKCPKLEVARRKSDGACSLLVLETTDMMLGDQFALDGLVQLQLKQGDSNLADHVWIIDTGGGAAMALISKEGPTAGRAITNRRFELSAESTTLAAAAHSW